jgi:hypothetical protein
MDIELNFINDSRCLNNAEVLIFMKNVATDTSSLIKAWHVIRYCAVGCSHPFVLSTDLEINVSDEYGNHSPRKISEPGGLYRVVSMPKGRWIGYAGVGAIGREVQVLNVMSRGAINVNAYSNGQQMASKTGVAPGQKAVFKFFPVLWITCASDVSIGQSLDSAIIDGVSTEMPLMGIKSADIVMTGGGSDMDAEPIVFSLENIVRA